MSGPRSSPPGIGHDRARRGGLFYIYIALAAGLAFAPACGGSDLSVDEIPKPALGSSNQAQVEFRSLHARWAAGSRADRLALERELVAFRSRFPQDDQGRMAHALLAWAALERGDLDRAAVLARAVRVKGAGTARDIAQTVEGAALRRRGRPAEALAKLSPIVSKLIDAYARSFLNEEVVTSALAARQFTTAVELMSVWLREAEEDERGAVRSRIEQLLPQVPPEDLTRTLDRRLKQGASATFEGDLPKSEAELRKLLARQLAAVARERRDVRLAKHLMATSGPLLGDQGDAVAQLAAGSGRARVEAPTVGLLLSLRTDAARRRGVEVAMGLTHGIGLPGSSARLASRDDGGELSKVREALTGLSAEGAAVIVAGIDEDEATEAASFAEDNEIPVVLLRPPNAPVAASGFVFVVGVSSGVARETLTTALVEKGVGRIALVADSPPTDAPTTDARTTTGAMPGAAAVFGKCGEAIDAPAWKSAGVTGALVDGDSECARSVIAKTAGLSLRYGFGIEAASAGLALPSGSLVLTAGRFPIVVQPTNEPWLAGWFQHRHAPPSYWAALGRDAGILAWAGVQALPSRGTEEPKEVRLRRAAARDALAAATAELWTADAEGFEGGRVLRRHLGVRELSKAAPRRR